MVYVFTLPWDNILQFGEPIGSAGRVAAFIAFAGSTALVVTGGKMRRLRPFHDATVGYLVIVALSILWTADRKILALCTGLRAVGVGSLALVGTVSAHVPSTGLRWHTFWERTSQHSASFGVFLPRRLPPAPRKRGFPLTIGMRMILHWC